MIRVKIYVRTWMQPWRLDFLKFLPTQLLQEFVLQKLLICGFSFHPDLLYQLLLS